MNCPASMSEIENDQRQNRNATNKSLRAPSDWVLVQETAQLLLDEKVFHTVRTGGFVNNRFYRSVKSPAKFDMGDVLVMLLESDGSPALLAAQAKCEPGAADVVADLIRRCAYEVAFYALELEDRWGELQTLIGEATK